MRRKNIYYLKIVFPHNVPLNLMSHFTATNPIDIGKYSCVCQNFSARGLPEGAGLPRGIGGKTCTWVKCNPHGVDIPFFYYFCV